MTVRVAISDSSGNQATKQFTLEPSDPGVDQTALAKEIGVPPLPDQPFADAAQPPPVTSMHAPAAAATGSADDPRGWSPESAGTWSDGQPATPQPAASPGRSVLVRPANTSAAGLLPQAGPRPTPQRQPLGDTGIAQSATDSSLEYRGRPLQLTKSRRFAWDYDIPSTRPAAGPLRDRLALRAHRRPGSDLPLPGARRRRAAHAVQGHRQWCLPGRRARPLADERSPALEPEVSL